MKIDKPLTRKIRKILFYIVLLVIAIGMIYPYIWSITASFKTNKQIYSGNPLDLIPKPAVFENYTDALTLLPFSRFLLNSTALSIIVPLFSILISTIAAYAFARLRFKGRDVIFMILLGVMMMPGHITLIPNYILMRYLGWLDKYISLIIPPIFGAGIVFNMFFMRQYFLAIPKELEEAAIIDGCSRFDIFWRIILPNSKPALATIAIIAFKSEWNTFLWPLVAINDYHKMPIQVGLSYFKANINTSWGTLLAGTVLSILPMVIIFVIFQRYFIRGMLTSGLAGK